jgi:hypothetical protein
MLMMLEFADAGVKTGTHRVFGSGATRVFSDAIAPLSFRQLIYASGIARSAFRTSRGVDGRDQTRIAPCEFDEPARCRQW